MPCTRWPPAVTWTATGPPPEQLGAVAVSQREWAVGNPIARFRDPISIEDHQRSRIVCDPLHLLDCCMVSNGGIAFIVTSAERAKDLPQPPVYVLGWGKDILSIR